MARKGAAAAGMLSSVYYESVSGVLPRSPWAKERVRREQVLKSQFGCAPKVAKMFDPLTGQAGQGQSVGWSGR